MSVMIINVQNVSSVPIHMTATRTRLRPGEVVVVTVEPKEETMKATSNMRFKATLPGHGEFFFSWPAYPVTTIETNATLTAPWPTTPCCGRSRDTVGRPPALVVVDAGSACILARCSYCLHHYVFDRDKESERQAAAPRPPPHAGRDILALKEETLGMHDEAENYFHLVPCAVCERPKTDAFVSVVKRANGLRVVYLVRPDGYLLQYLHGQPVAGVPERAVGRQISRTAVHAACMTPADRFAGWTNGDVAMQADMNRQSAGDSLTWSAARHEGRRRQLRAGTFSRR